MSCRAAWILTLLAVAVPLYLLVCAIACLVGALVVAVLSVVFSGTVVVAAYGAVTYWLLVIACVVCGASSMGTFVLWAMMLAFVSARCPRGLA